MPTSTRSIVGWLIASVFVAGSIIVALYIAYAPGSCPQTVLERADLVNKVATAFGLMAAGLWALFTFVLFRTGVTNLVISIQPRIQPLSADKRVLMINVILRNAGRVVVTPGEGSCTLSLRRLSTDAPAGTAVDLEAGALILEEHDLLACYDEKHPYQIEPGAEYHEFCAVPIPPNTLLAIKVTFYLGTKDDDAITERRLLFVK